MQLPHYPLEQRCLAARHMTSITTLSNKWRQTMGREPLTPISISAALKASPSNIKLPISAIEFIMTMRMHRSKYTPSMCPIALRTLWKKLHHEDTATLDRHKTMNTWNTNCVGCGDLAQTILFTSEHALIRMPMHNFTDDA